VSEGDQARGHRPDEPKLPRRPSARRLKEARDPRIAVDTGGTFTDFVRIGAEGIRVFKLSSTPAAPERAILEGLGREPGEGGIVHGSTVATNALLERRGARTALVTTAGFEDVLAIGRQARPALYDIRVSRPEPLVPRRLRLGLRQRTRPDGTAQTPLEPADLERLRERLARLRPESIAVSLLFSFEAPEVERSVREALAPLGIPVSLSSEILPEYREFERTSTTVVNAYLAPVMARYLERLERGVGRRPLRVMQSNGGAVPARAARSAPVRTLLSGPAGGVVAALRLAKKAGYDRIITFDMGGTSTDVALLDGEIATTRESLVDGLPVGVPMMDIHTVGAGGGSIAAVDPGGALGVGPASAGADPGPACYGRGSDFRLRCALRRRTSE
jgi:N-methylhydantoinase A/oxoprolinase/acetone carboxylase beta subunit